MTTLAEWITECANGEPVEAVMLGSGGWYYDGHLPRDIDYKSVYGKVLTWEQAQPYISYEMTETELETACPAVEAYTKSWVIALAEGDGWAYPIRVHRNPIEGEIPEIV